MIRREGQWPERDNYTKDSGYDRENCGPKTRNDTQATYDPNTGDGECDGNDSNNEEESAREPLVPLWFMSLPYLLLCFHATYPVPVLVGI